MGTTSSKLSTGLNQADYFLHALPDHHLVKVLPTQNSRFLKTLQCLSHEGMVVVKVYTVRQGEADAVEEEEKKLAGVSLALGRARTGSNLMPYLRVLRQERCAFLVRQYFQFSLYERMGTRPFLSPVEKEWIVYQLVHAVAEAHACGVCHGDIKAENVMLTSYSWLYLVDFASYKPTRIPVTDPSDYSYFFNSSGRTAYLAPERFGGSEDKGAPLRDSMDIFSLGCVVAELYLEERVLFDFARLGAYREGTYDPAPLIDTIQNEGMRHLVRQCISLDPEARPTAHHVLEHWQQDYGGRPYFGFLHKYFRETLGPLSDPDDRVKCISRDFGFLLGQLSGMPELVPEEVSPVVPSRSISIECQEARRMAELRARLRQVDGTDVAELVEAVHNAAGGLDEDVAQESEATTPVEDKKAPEKGATPAVYVEGAVLVLPVVKACVRNVRTPASKVAALRSLVRLASFVSEDVCLERVLPYVFSVLPADDNPLVRASVIRSAVAVLEAVKMFPVSDARIFLNYVLPTIGHFSKDPEELVRETLASSLASLTHTSQRLLENIKGEGYDAQLSETRRAFERVVRDLLEHDENLVVKRRLLADLTNLCLFFGRRVATETFVPFLITFLSHEQWQLRAAAYDNFVGVMSVVGSKPLEDITLALIIKSFADEEEWVVEKALSSVASLCGYALYRKQVLLQLVSAAAPTLLHPNVWVRYAAIRLVGGVASQMGLADRYCFVRPVLAPFVRFKPRDLEDGRSLLEALKPPLSREAFDSARSFGVVLMRQGVSGPAWAEQFATECTEVPAAARGYFEALAEGTMSRVEPEESTEEPVGTYEVPLVLTGVTKVPAPAGVMEKSSDVLDAEEFALKYSGRAAAEAASPAKEIDAAVDVLEPAAAAPTVPPMHSWRPRGVLVAHLHEHSATVSSLCVSRDSSYFVSGSWDGSVKVWDVRRPHSVSANRSRHTRIMCRERLTSVALVENTDAIACGNDAGVVQLCSIGAPGGERKKYVLKNVGVRDASKEGGVVQLTHYERGNSSLLVSAMSRGAICAWDLRCRAEEPAFVLRNAAHLGLLTAFVVEPNRNWLLSGTNEGGYTIWDMRFQVPVKSFPHPQSRAVRDLQSGPGSLVFSATADGFISEWNVETCERVRVLCGSGMEQKPDLLKRTIRRQNPSYPTLVTHAKITAQVYSSHEVPDELPSVRAMCARPEFLVSGGTDACLRFWDLQRPTHSYVISGVGAKDTVTYEETPEGNVTEKITSGGDDGYIPVSAHKDTITQITITKKPTNMLISASRSGDIKVWK